MVALRKPAPPLPPQTPRLRVLEPPSAPRVREDALPEHTDYRDTGCEVSPSCLDCPLARCKYDEPSLPRSHAYAARDREIVLLRTKYRMPVEMISKGYGISRRSVFRIMQEAGHGRRKESGRREVGNEKRETGSEKRETGSEKPTSRSTSTIVILNGSEAK